MTRPLSNLNLALNRGSIFGAGGGFSPIDIPSLSCWIDPQNPACYVLGTPPVLVSANCVPGTGAVGYGTVSTNRPNLTVVNSRDMFGFTPLDYFTLTTGAADLQPGSSDFTFVVTYRATGAFDQVLWVMDDLGGLRWFLRLLAAGTMQFSIDDNTVAQTITANDASFGNDDIYIIMATRDGTNIRLYWGNGGAALAEASASPVAIGAYGNIDSANGRIASYVNNTQGVAGETGDFLFYKSALSGSERTDLYNYLVSQWGL